MTTLPAKGPRLGAARRAAPFLVLLVLAGLAVLLAFAPAQDSSLFRAVGSGQTRLVQAALREHPEQINQRRLGRTPLHLAAFCRRHLLARLLLQHGAQVNKANDFGQTALYVAAFVNAPTRVLTNLLQYGADPLLPDRQGRTALGISPSGAAPPWRLWWARASWPPPPRARRRADSRNSQFYCLNFCKRLRLGRGRNRAGTGPSRRRLAAPGNNRLTSRPRWLMQSPMLNLTNV